MSSANIRAKPDRPVGLVMPGPESIRTFQQRRTAFWRVIRWWLLTGVASVLAVASLVWDRTPAIGSPAFRASWLLMLATGVCGLVITLVVRRRYRCPVCHELPMRTAPHEDPEIGDLAWNPVDCPRCGAPLR